MSKRKYYSERKGVLSKSKLGLSDTVKGFLHIYSTLQSASYFQEAMGYNCVDDGRKNGTWGENPDLYVLVKLKRSDMWPIKENHEHYDEPTLFTIIEFLYDHVSKPTEGYEHEWNNCGWHYSKFDKDAGQTRYRDDVNDFLSMYEDGYDLNIDGEIHRIPPSGMVQLVSTPIVTSDPTNIDERIQYAIDKFHHHSSGISEKKDAVRTLGDVLEYLQKQGIRFSKKDEGALFRIINEFDMRHHRKSQQGDYDKEVFYEWMFYTFLASIKLLVDYAMKTGQHIL